MTSADAHAVMEAKEERDRYIEVVLECLENVSSPEDALDLIESVDVEHPWSDTFELEDAEVVEHIGLNPRLSFAQVFAWVESGGETTHEDRV